MASADMQKLAQVLQETLQPDPNRRKTAEGELFNLESVPGFGPLLIELVVTESASQDIRIAAAISAKNFVKRQWGDMAEKELADQEKATIRETALRAMLTTSGNLRKQLSHTVFLIAKKDFPTQWPNLVGILAEQLTSDNFERIVATLSTLDQIFEKYRYESKSNALWSELKLCLTAVQEPLTGLFGKMLEIIPQKDQLSSSDAGNWIDVLRLIARIYHSLASQDLPEYFEDNLKPWMEGFMALLAMTVDSQRSTAGEATPLDKLKAEICGIVTLYAQRYEEEITPFMRPLIEGIWGLLVNTGSDTRYDGLVCAALDFLAAICLRTKYEDLFRGEGVLQTIAIDIAVKNLTLREEDIELFEDEPLEYMKKDIEGTDMGTRRRGAIDLIRNLCKTFEAALVNLLAGVINDSLKREANWLQRDVVYCLITAMAKKGETQRMGATSTSELINVADFYKNAVYGELSTEIDSSAILKADAIKFLVTFRTQLPPQDIVQSIPLLLKLLGSRHVQVHKYAAWAVERLLLMRIEGRPLFSAANVPVAPFLAALVACFDADPKSQNSYYLIKALMRIVNILDSNTAAAGGQIAMKLVSMVEQTIRNPADPIHTHFLFETMCVLIKKASAHVAGGLDPSLLPIIEMILAQEMQDLIPYALQLTGVLLADCVTRGAPADAYLGFLSFLMRQDFWAKSANIPAVLSLLEIYLKALPDKVCESYSTLLVTQYVRLISSKNLELYGFKLASLLLPHMQRLQGIDNPFAILFNNILKRLRDSKTPRFNKHFLVFVARFVVVVNVETFVKVLEQMQPGLYRMIMEKIVGPALCDCRAVTTADEKRTIGIGFGRLFSETAVALGDAIKALAFATRMLLDEPPVSTNFGQTLEDEQASMYNAEGEFVNPYSQLSNAGLREEVLVPEITDHKAFFEAAVSRIPL
ncbi:unnamed protein product, partial [Mesorhabditis spiculigera]